MTKTLVQPVSVNKSFWMMESAHLAVSLTQIAMSAMPGTIVLLAKTKVSI
jgi:hypothetical protein